MKNKNLLLSGIIVGFALFSTYFGAGNLIFPPYIGVMTGSNFSAGILGMTISAIFLPIIAVVGVLNSGGSMDTIMKPLGKRYMQFFFFINYTFLALGSTLPRCAATTYEMGVEPLLGNVPIIVSSVIFFAIFYLLARKKESVVDKLGKYLTPALLILLVIIIIKVVTDPIGLQAAPKVEKPLVEATLNGYLTGDLTLGILCGGMFISALKDQGYDDKSVRKGTYIACIVAFIGLFIVYGGLVFGGASLSTEYTLDAERTTLLIEIVRRALGNVGLMLLSGAVTLACLTTSVGLGANAASFLEELTNHKIKYKTWIAGIAVLCCILSVQGVTGLIDYVTPLFAFLYPIFIVITFLGIFDKRVPNDGVYKGGAALSSLFGLLDAIVIVSKSAALDGFLKSMPLGEYGFAWLVPTIIGMVVGYFLYKGKPRVQELA